jgi:lipopolysaccharide/colanic/teichoic acid biosynthesis glycosyltransferase
MLTEKSSIVINKAQMHYYPTPETNYLIIRRYIDLAVIILLLPIELPVFSVFTIILFFHFKGQVFFTQKRAGYQGKPFIMYKFKTMLDCSDINENYLHHNYERETKFGSFLRKHRIDEIPQLLNVIKGEMSLIGPRPEAYYHYEYFSDKIDGYWLRKSVPQGLTGLAQISYPYTDTLEGTIEKLNYDFLYIRDLSLKTDIMIAFRTLVQLLTGK